MEETSYTFDSTLESSDNKLWGAHFAVPGFVVEALNKKGEARRVVCTLNEKTAWQCALLPRGDDVWLISVNKSIRTQLKLEPGARLSVRLTEDKSEYGLPMPEEFEELLRQDEAGNRLFEALTPGKKRNLLYIVNQPKTSDKKIARGLIVLEHLVQNRGKIDFKQLYEALKTGSGN